MEEGWCDDDVEVLEASDTGGAADGWGRGQTCLRQGNPSLSHQASASLPANHVAQVLARSLKLTCALTHGVDEGEGFYCVLST